MKDTRRGNLFLQTSYEDFNIDNSDDDNDDNDDDVTTLPTIFSNDKTNNLGSSVSSFANSTSDDEDIDFSFEDVFEKLYDDSHLA